MPDCPDVLGMELPEALALLQDAGFIARVVITGPPRGGIGGAHRVLRATRLEGRTVEVVAAPQGWDEHDGRPLRSVESRRS